ncbi:MAG: tripartite tricarboxylate transporter substrate binding protein [Paracoccus sp. (in: a-proteobacteria)]|uniref:Bug family tripartite tricarboxylate transporter substrate binding protein n=1 Tax=Paracoccus sp. TaxID=267 RepID=UPI0039E7225A
MLHLGRTGARAARLAAVVLALCGLAATAGPAQAEDYPAKPITLIYPFPPGGGGDASIRLIADALQARTGVPVVVMNKAGGSGMLGFQTLRQAAPDGYTFSALHNGLTVIRSIADPGFDAAPGESYAPVAILWEGVSKIAANPKAPFATLAEFIAYARAHPGEVTVSMGGVGSTDHISAAGLMRYAGIDFNLVSYNGSVAAIQAAVSGEVMATISAVPVENQIAAGQLVKLGLAVSDASPLAPGWEGLGTVGIEGFKGLNNWMGLYAPPGTPPGIVEKINAEIAAIFAENPDLAARVRLLAGGFAAASPTEISGRIAEETERERPVVTALDIQF